MNRSFVRTARPLRGPRTSELEGIVTDQIRNCQRALDGAYATIAPASSEALSNPTPCEGWDARALIDHMIGVVQNFTSGFTGGPPLTQATGQSIPGQSGDDPAAAYRQAADALMAAVRQPGALDKTLKLPFGEMPGDRAINIVIADQAIHTWDLAKTFGKPYTMDEDLASGILTMMHQIMSPAARGAGKAFAEEVPCSADAPVQDRLLAFSGRQP
jgi:uncharacterized protein (TIGR03086 family)